MTYFTKCRKCGRRIILNTTCPCQKHSLMKVLAITFVLMFVFIAQAFAGTRVWFHYGWGDNAFGSSSGVNEMAAAAATIPGVTQVTIHNYWQTQQTADEIMAAPPGDRIVISGYSCGANSSTTIAYGINPHRKVDVAVIQESLYCGGYPLAGNVNRAQETYAQGLTGCIITLGFGCKTMTAGAGFTGQLVLIDRPDLHSWADTDPNAQNDILSFIAGTTPTLKMKRGPRIIHVTRFNGQRL